MIHDITFEVQADDTRVYLGEVTLTSPVTNTMPLTHPMCEIYRQPNYIEIWDSVLKKLKDKFGDKIYSFDLKYEVINLEFFSQIGVLSNFRNHDMTFEILDGNTYPHAEYDGISKFHNNTFLGKTTMLTDLFLLDNRTFDKHFTCLMGAQTPHRDSVCEILYNNNLLHRTYLTYLAHEPDAPFSHFLDDGMNFKNGVIEDYEDTSKRIIPTLPAIFTPTKFHKNGFCHIITESSYHDDIIRVNDVDYAFGEIVFVTEKTEKCFTAGQPFVMVAKPYTLQYLRKLGFQTFDKWWDESYDLELDDDKRMTMIEDVIKYISSLTLRELRDIHTDMRSVLDNNRHTNEMISKNQLDVSRCKIYSL